MRFTFHFKYNYIFHRRIYSVSPSKLFLIVKHQLIYRITYEKEMGKV